MESLVHAMLSNALAATVLAILVASLGRVCRRPALIHGLWLVVMLKLVTPPLVPVSLPMGLELLPSGWSGGEAGEGQQESSTLAAMTHDVAAETEGELCAADLPGDENQGMSGVGLPSGQIELNTKTPPAIPAVGMSFDLRLPEGWRWEYLMLALVLSGAVAWWVIAALRIIRFNRLMNEIAPAPFEWQTRTAELAGRLGLCKPPCLYLVPGRVPPMLWAIGSRPRLLVPSELWPATSLEQRTSLLLHELAHLKRRDHWVRWLELIVGGLYWWHPAVWWGRRLLREAEEQCCDAWVVWAMPKGAKIYATALLTALEFVSGARTAPAASSATSGNGHVSCLKRRLKMIVRAQTPKGLSWNGRLAVLATAAFLLPLAPSWGQKNDDDAPAAEVNSVTDFYEYDISTAEAVQAGDRSYQRAQYEDYSENSRDTIFARFFQDDAKKDEPTKEDKGRATAERFEEHVKDVIEKLVKELGPVGEDLRKILEKSIDDIHETLKKESVGPDDLRKSLEKSHNEMRKGLEKGGSVNKELRETVEKSRRDLQSEWERARSELRMAMRDRTQPRRGQERTEEAQKDSGKEDSAKKEAAEIEKDRAELEKARAEVRALEQQLRQASRRLGEMQRRTMQRRGPVGKRRDAPTALDRTPDDQPSKPEASPRSPRSPATPAKPATPASPRRVEPPAAARQPVAPRRPPGDGTRGPGSNVNPQYEQRLRNFENKLEELLKEMKKLKEEKKPEESKNSSPRRGRSSNPGTPVVF